MRIRFKQHVLNNFPRFQERKVGIAISGGVDSVVLAQLCYSLNLDITLLHCNFQLRGDASNEDQTFVKHLAEALKAPFVTTEFNTSAYANEHKVSIQVAARELRYSWFKKMAKLHRLDVVLTAHHADDNLETFLINLSRGSGLEGLTGIPKVNNIYQRPLLPFSKKQILAFAEKNNISWREDASNQDSKYLRNKIRNEVVPLLKEANSSLLNNFTKSISYLLQSQDVVADYINKIKSDILIEDPSIKGFKLSIQNLKKERHYQLVLFEILKPFKFTAWNDINDLVEAQSGKKVISNKYTLLKDRDYLLLYPNATKTEKLIVVGKEDVEISISENELLLISDFKTTAKPSKNKITLDLNKLNFPLTVRKWRQGDYFYPVGMTGKKKISKFFKDKKFSIPEKDNIWLLCSEGEVVWVVNQRVDRRFVSEEAVEKITIEFKRVES